MRIMFSFQNRAFDTGLRETLPTALPATETSAFSDDFECFTKRRLIPFY